jgi:lipid-A-disaccharide synthase
MLRVGIVAGEPSGDLLAVGLIKEIKALYPDAQFEGIAGPLMIAEGCRALWPLEKLSVFGLFEVLKHLPELLSIRKNLFNHFIQNPPDIFIGVDAPDFNLALERKLFQANIPTVHYVSPTVWAWRPGRIKKLIGSLSALLCVFPFEEDYFKKTPVPAHFIGHPLADEVVAEDNLQQSKEQFGFSVNETVIALLPGSRMGELSRHAELFLAAAALFSEQNNSTRFIATFATERTRQYFEQLLASIENPPTVEIVDSSTTAVLAASDMALVASGTVSLEVMLMRKPMVVAYRFAPATYWLLDTFSLFKAAFFSMPNLIAGKKIIPELLQDEVTKEHLVDELQHWKDDQVAVDNLIVEYDRLIPMLRKDASKQAAKVVLDVVSKASPKTHE